MEKCLTESGEHSFLPVYRSRKKIKKTYVFEETIEEIEETYLNHVCTKCGKTVNNIG